MSNTTFQYLTSGSGATYTTPAGCVAIHVQAWGGGGGGGGGGTGANTAGGAGGDTIFNSVHAKGGLGGSQGTNATGGNGGKGTTAGTGTAAERIIGSAGNAGSNASGPGNTGGIPGASSLGGAGSIVLSAAGTAAAVNSGSGGAGGGAGNNGGGGGGQAGEAIIIDINSPSSTYTYTIGAAGSAGTGSLAGGAGGSGLIIVTEYYGGTITLTGDVTGSGTGSFATTIKSNVALAGNPTTTTQTAGDNSTKIATTAYVDAGLSGKSSSTLMNAHLLVGNASNVATDTAVTGDVTISNTGVTAIKSSVSLAGSPTTTTQVAGDNSTKIATTAYVDAGITGIKTLTSAHLLVGNASNVATDTAITGDVTISNTGVTTIQPSAVSPAMLESNLIIEAFGITIDGNGYSPGTGSAGYVTIPYSGTIANWYLAANLSGSCVIDIKRSGASIVGAGNKPTLSGAQFGNAAISGWTSITITAGDIIEFNLNSIATMTRVNLVIKLIRS